MTDIWTKPAPSGLMLTIAGEPVPIEDVSWIAVAPCGCVSGVTTSDRYVNDKRDGFIVTADEARRNFSESAIEVKRDEEDGFTYRPIKHANFRDEVGDMNCPHFPKWGVAKAAVPDGHEWATLDGAFGRQSHLKHIVPSEHVRRFKDTKIHNLGVRALCGKAGRSTVWNDLTFFTGVTCRKCEKTAGYETAEVSA